MLLNTIWNIANFHFLLPTIVQTDWTNKDNTDEQLFEADIEGVPKHAYYNKLGTGDDHPLDSGFRWTYAHWPNGIVPYVIQQGFFSKPQMNLLQEVMKSFEYQTCVKFVRRHNQANYIHIKFNSLKCSSDVSMTGGEQIVWLTSFCISDRNDIFHELMHVLGFYHEQNRPDRDKYVKINAENIYPNKLYNFKIQHESNVTTFDTPYDFESIMHYKSNAFSINGKPTIEPKEKGVEIKADGLSLLDLTEINRMYNCSEETTVNLPCICSSCDQKNIHEESTAITRHNTEKEIQWNYHIWPNGVIPYVITDGFTSTQKSFIEMTMKEISDVSCVKFRSGTFEQNYVEIQFTYWPCSSHVGFQNRGKQNMYLDSECTKSRNGLLHVLMHTLGFFHEHNRPDRDKYVTVQWENIVESERKNFMKFTKDLYLNMTYFDTPYDFASITHASMNASSKNGKPTITPIENDVEIKANGLSKIDVLKINRLYKCSEEVKKKVPLICYCECPKRFFAKPPFSSTDLKERKIETRETYHVSNGYVERKPLSYNILLLFSVLAIIFYDLLC